MLTIVRVFSDILVAFLHFDICQYFSGKYQIWKSHLNIREGLNYADSNPYYHVFQGLAVKGIVKEYVFVMLMPSHSHGVTFGLIEFHLSIGFPLS